MYATRLGNPPSFPIVLMAPFKAAALARALPAGYVFKSHPEPIPAFLNVFEG